ncbi:hypothetical protein ACRARG_09375 [Pseudooceanicola sp. C21-150M6]|uniref:hypothetical protein n=1 Tax=Pseudooceanicola sp. C21-150M6 TaxID=3434355 RepID=UPI003D7F5673
MTPLRIAALALMTGASAGPSLALSCMRPDVATSYQLAQKEAADYVIVEGHLSHDITGVPRNRPKGAPPVTFPARIEGRALTSGGFTAPFSGPVTVTLTCQSIWCAPAPPQEAEVIVFLRKASGGAFVLEAQPCRRNIFVDPPAGSAARILACHQGRDCPRPRP